MMNYTPHLWKLSKLILPREWEKNLKSSSLVDQDTSPKDYKIGTTKTACSSTKVWCSYQTTRMYDAKLYNSSMIKSWDIRDSGKPSNSSHENIGSPGSRNS